MFSFDTIGIALANNTNNLVGARKEGRTSSVTQDNTLRATRSVASFWR